MARLSLCPQVADRASQESGLLFLLMFIGLHWVLVPARRVLVVSCRVFGCSAQALWWWRKAPECGLSSCDMQAKLLHSMWDLSTPTADQTYVPCIERQILNLWTTREVPVLFSWGINPIVRTPLSWPHPDAITSTRPSLLLPSHGGLGLQLGKHKHLVQGITTAGPFRWLLSIYYS